MRRADHNGDVLTLKLNAIDDGIAVILPAGVLAQLGWKEGDELLAVPTRDGLMLSSPGAEVAEDVRLGQQLLMQYRNTLDELAK